MSSRRCRCIGIVVIDQTLGAQASRSRIEQISWRIPEVGISGHIILSVKIVDCRHDKGLELCIGISILAGDAKLGEPDWSTTRNRSGLFHLPFEVVDSRVDVGVPVNVDKVYRASCAVA